MRPRTGTGSEESFLTHANEEYKNPHNRQKKSQNPDIIEYTEEMRSSSDMVAEQREHRKIRWGRGRVREITRKERKIKDEAGRWRGLAVLTGSIDGYKQYTGFSRTRVNSQRRQHSGTPTYPGQGDLMPGPDSLCKCRSQLLLSCFGGVMNNSPNHRYGNASAQWILPTVRQRTGAAPACSWNARGAQRAML